MSEAYDIVIRGGRVATASDVFDADVAITGESIAAIGKRLPPGKRDIDAKGKLVLPGGIDSHCHIEQLSANGKLNADSFESATTSAAFGGTTTVIPFAAQHRGMKLREVVADYHKLAERGAVIDYAFHMIIANPTRETLDEDIPALIETGHSSLKVFMTYDRLKVEDEELLDVLAVARKCRAMVCVHAENHGVISWMVKRLLAHGHTAPKFHAVSHARAAESEAINRLIEMAALIDQPIMVYHVSTAEGAAVIRAARGRGLKVFSETCPQYLFLTQSDLDRPGVEGAKWMCSPPLRLASDQEALVARHRIGRHPDRVVRPCALSPRRRRQISGGRRLDLQGDRERHARSRGTPAAPLRRHGLEGAPGLAKIRRGHGHRAGAYLQPFAQRLDRRRRWMPISPSGMPVAASPSRTG